MKNYYAYTPSFFDTNEDEIKKLKMGWNYSVEKFNLNLEKIRKYFKEGSGIDIIDFTIRVVPEKRSKYDNAVLLCLKKSDGKFIAKRFHNNQVLDIEY